LPADEHHPGYTRRIYDNSLPPLDRLCTLEAIPSDKQAELLALSQATNPIALRQEIQILIDRLCALACTSQGVNKDVRLTLRKKTLTSS
jgi:hypothetical protein